MKRSEVKGPSKPANSSHKQAGKGSAKPLPEAAKRQPTEREAALIASAKAADALRPSRAEIEKRESKAKEVLAIGPRHSDENGASYTLVDAFATTSEYYTSESLLQLAEMSIAGGAVSNDKVNAKLALLGAIAPQNELEAALALQMIATHDLSMMMLARTKNAAHLDGLREYGNMATKLSRTFTAQMKALSDWRRGGEQVVRHVHVYEGGQAVVAETINVGGPTNAITGDQCHAPFSALPRPHQVRDAVPRSSGEGSQSLPNARGKEPRRAPWQ